MQALTQPYTANCLNVPISARRASVYPGLFRTPLDATLRITSRLLGRGACARSPASQLQRRPSAPGIVCEAGRGSGEPWWLKDNPPNMKDINSIQELVDTLADAGDRLVIVEFYAQWCNACRALFPKICKLVSENPEVLFLKVNFDDNRDASRTLGVKVLPFFHLYRGAEGRVASFSCTISKLHVFKDALENFSSPFCSLEPAPGLVEFPAIIAHPEGHSDAAAAAGLTSGEDEADLHPLANTPTVVG